MGKGLYETLRNIISILSKIGQCENLLVKRLAYVS